MERVILGDVALEYEVAGSGEPVVLIHGSFVADTFRPLLAQPILTHGYQMISYHRRGYVGSSPLEGVLSIAEQAADCLGLIGHLNIQTAHIVGHSFGGAVALQVALDAPDVVGTLALLEPALAIGDSGPAYRQSLASLAQRYREVGPTFVVDETLQARWPDYEDRLEEALPGAFDQAVADAPAIFDWELPGLLDWSFDEEVAQRISQPVLAVLGGRSEALWPRFGETQRALVRWLADVEEYVLPGATHFLQTENPVDMATALSGFFERHPLRS